MSVSYGGDKITFDDGSTVSSGWAGFKNRIINGAMVVDQRNAGAVKYGQNQASSVYTVDRWQLYHDNSSANLQVQQSSTAPPGFNNSACITINTGSATAANNECQFRHGIEGYNMADLKWGTADAVNATISFWIRSSLTGTFSLGFQNAGTTSVYVTTYTINQANTWEYKTITIPGPTSGTFEKTTSSGVYVIFDAGGGSNFNTTANTWTTGNKYSVAGTTKLMATTGATMFITGVQLEKGSQASSFEWRPFGTEFDLCRRYCEVFRYDVEGGIHQGLAQVDGSQRPETNLFYYTKRAAPTITSYNMTGQSLFNNMNNGQVTVNSEVSTYVGTGIRGTNLFWGTGGTCAPGTLSGIGYIILVGTAYIVVSAEL
jgi:hypothetical protein